MTIYLLENRQAFQVCGPDAYKLLSDVFTGKIPQEQNEAHWWALLSPQGKIQAEGLIGLSEGMYWLDVSTEIAAHFYKRMGMYKLRADAQIIDCADTHKIGWAFDRQEHEAFVSHHDARHDDLGFRIIAPVSQVHNWKTGSDTPVTTRVKLGIAELGSDFNSDTLFPHDVGMDLLDGIDFDKGCYVGQEVVSRMRHRGNVRRRPVIVSLNVGKAGDEILLDGKNVGKIGAVRDGLAVGIVRLDKITPKSNLSIEDMPVSISLPPWANYGFAPVSESR